jgi:hypothetical protein
VCEIRQPPAPKRVIFELRDIVRCRPLSGFQLAIEQTRYAWATDFSTASGEKL